MPSFASARRSCTAWAAMCADEWRRIARPSSEVARIASTVEPSDTSWARSKVSPATFMATTDWSSPKRSSPVVVPCRSFTSEVSAWTTVMLGTVFLSVGQDPEIGQAGAWAPSAILLHPLATGRPLLPRGDLWTCNGRRYRPPYGVSGSTSHPLHVRSRRGWVSIDPESHLGCGMRRPCPERPPPRPHGWRQRELLSLGPALYDRDVLSTGFACMFDYNCLHERHPSDSDTAASGAAVERGLWCSG